MKRYRSHYRNTSGHLYQGRSKSFVVQEDGHLLTLLWYVEANPLRAKMVPKTQEWRWSSLGCDPDTRADLLSEWPIDRPKNWTALVNRKMETEQISDIQHAIVRDRPLGDAAWTNRMAKQLGLEYTLRDRGRPRKDDRKNNHSIGHVA